MKIFSIQNYQIPVKIKSLNKKIDYLNSKAEKLMKQKSTVTGLLPNSMRKCHGTDMSVPQMIDLILRSLP